VAAAACAALGASSLALGGSGSASAARQRVVAAAAAGGSAGRKAGGRAARKKGELPTKACATCGLAFEYRAKWSKVWDEVRYCSERCRRNRGQAAAAGDARPAQ
jgi:hypothetical protein